jgi:hypothetical protein
MAFMTRPVENSDVELTRAGRRAATHYRLSMPCHAAPIVAFPQRGRSRLIGRVSWAMVRRLDEAVAGGALLSADAGGFGPASIRKKSAARRQSSKVERVRVWRKNLVQRV